MGNYSTLLKLKFVEKLNHLFNTKIVKNKFMRNQL